MTVLFADICGFTNLSSSIDSEDVHSLLAEYFEIADGIIKDYGGTVDKHVGDSVMAVFGAPISHGNDAERAVRAAVAIQDAMPRISDRVGRPLQTHIGIACGEVVASGVGPDSHYTVIGDSVNLAARLTDKAQAGEVFVSDVVRQSISANLATTDVGKVSVKGLSAPVQVFSVLGPNVGTDARQTRPLVGRTSEIRQFQIALEGCQDASQGQLIQIRGDAGIGKTRLTDEFYRMASNSGFTCNRSLILDFGVGHGQDPIRSLVRGLLDISSDEEEGARRVAASEAISKGIVPAEKEVYLRDLLNVPQASEGQALYDAMDNMTRNAGKDRNRCCARPHTQRTLSAADHFRGRTLGGQAGSRTHRQTGAWRGRRPCHSHPHVEDRRRSNKSSVARIGGRNTIHDFGSRPVERGRCDGTDRKLRSDH